MSLHKFIVWHDTLGTEANFVECLSYEGRDNLVNAPPLASGDFVIIDDSDQQTSWMAQVVEPQRNLPLQGLSRDSPSAVAVFERILRGEIEKTIFLNQVYYYRLQLIGEIVETGRLTSVRRRPRAGSVGHIATEESVRRGLDLPAVENQNIMGRIHGTDIPVAIDWAAFKQHILVAGATGSGKSNSVANLIKAAQSYDACVVIYDQKPDYQNIDRPNDEKHLFDAWNPQVIAPSGLTTVSKYTLWQGDGETSVGEQAIAIRAREVSMFMLVSALFPYQDEGNQRDMFLGLLSYFSQTSKEWTLPTFADWVKTNRKSKKLQEIGDAQGWGQLNDMTLDAMQRKMSQRRMKWIDSLEDRTGSVARGGIFANGKATSSSPQGYFVPEQHLGPGKILVIRTNANGREYGLFLSYMLRKLYDLKRDGTISFPIVNIVDEAQDIFQGDSGIRDTATATMNDIIRKGRSKDIAFVIAAQSVSQIPDAVLTNMNTRFIHRQNSVEELRKAIPSASRELMTMSLTFGPGEALASIIGARSVVHAEMAPSPFELTKLSAAPRKTLADQDLADRFFAEMSEDDDEIPF